VRAVFVAADAGADADAGERGKAAFPQVGYAVGRHCGGAVVRNRLRRRMREVARQSAPDLPRGRYLLRLDPAAAGIPAAAFRAHVAEALQRAARAGAHRAPPTPVSR
jgi:ribonuclease P protein component